MTNRERQIIDLLKKNPMLTQKELADMLGIERSSIAVHLSNLTKKGIIQGKGYIINDAAYVLVIGGANMDIVGIPNDVLKLSDSNPGLIRHAHGGVGRNIAENLTRLSIPTKFISCLGEDNYGQEIENYALRLGIDMSHSLKTSQFSTSIYMSVLSEKGDMHVAVSDMSITTCLTPSYLAQKEALIHHATYVVLDTNLSEESFTYLFTHFPETAFIVDTVSTTKAIKIKNHLCALFAIKPNIHEAAVLVGHTLVTDEDIFNALLHFQEAGITYPMISLGSRGIAYLENTPDAMKNLSIYCNNTSSVVNANGAGDAFLSAFIYGLMHDFTQLHCIELGNKAAQLTLEVSSTINPNLNENILIEPLGGK